MSKRERMLLAVFGIVLVISAVWYFRGGDSGSKSLVNSVDAQYEPIPVENPLLRLDLLEGLHKVEYSGQHRNIFSEIAPPPQPTLAQKRAAEEAAKQAALNPPPPPPYVPPPVVVDVKFYGYVEDVKTGSRRAFFTNGDDVFIAGVGDTLENRLRVTRIGNDTVELEEISSQRHTTLPIEQIPGQS
jgi:hypothetical protein